jgi:sugar phosphate isomerase/epimerase
MDNMRKIQFGMPTLMECRSHDALIDLCKEIGCDFIELNANFPLYIREHLVSSGLFSRLEREGIGYSVHLPEVMDLGSLQSEFRDAALAMIASLTSAVREGTRFVYHMNSGINVSLPQENVYIYKRYEHEYLDSLEDIYSALDLVLDESGCKLCVENLGNFNLPFIQKGLEMLLSSEHIGLTWDFGHDTTALLSDTPFFERHLSKVWEIHLHDSKHGTDHRPLFSGNTNIEKALGLASAQGIAVVVEVKTVAGLKESYFALREHGHL